MVKRKVSRPMPKKSSAAAAATASPPHDPALKQGIWGLVYLSLGIILLLSMALHREAHLLIAETNPHRLGPWLGTRMAIGLFYIFGHATAVLYALAVCYVGVAKLAGKTLHLKLLMFIALLSVQLCVLIAVSKMPMLKDAGLAETANTVGANYIGLMLANFLLLPLFGARTFGPYFIVSLTMAITILLGLRIRPQTVGAFAATVFATCAAWFKKVFAEVKTGLENSPPIVSEETAANLNDVKFDKDKFSGTENIINNNTNAAVAADIADVNDINDINNNNDNNAESSSTETPKILTPEEEAKKRLEDELEAFRKSKEEPVQILIGDANEQKDNEEKSSEENENENELVTDDDTPPFDVDGAGADTVDYDDVIEEIDADYFDNDIVDADDDEDNEEESTEENENADDNDNFKVTELSSKPYVVPSPDIIPDPPPLADMVDHESIERNREMLEKTLMNFGVEGVVKSVCPGPVVARYEIVLAPGIKVSKVTSLQDDISLALGGLEIRIQAPIPGKAAIGIELPNVQRQFVYFKHILESDKFKKSKAKIPFVIGSDISGAPYIADIQVTPHLLIAGQTGSGKSVCINSLICSMLMTKKPEELRLIMIDPKKVELAFYENIPHLLAPIVSDVKEAVKALQWGVMEMERRYTLFEAAGVRKIEEFNDGFAAGDFEEKLSPETNKLLPYIVIIVDELNDFMMKAPKEFESNIMSIAQKARAAGIHLVLATQRPSVNVITGSIKANLPSRIAFRTFSAIDSRTILDQGGADKLLGNGDMLFYLNGARSVERFHGAYISERDVKTIVKSIIDQGADIDGEKINSFHDVIKDPEEEVAQDDEGGRGGGKRDELFNEAARLIVSTGLGSTSLLQRRLGIGFARAGRIMDQLEQVGIVGKSKGGKAREVLVTSDEVEEFLQ